MCIRDSSRLISPTTPSPLSGRGAVCNRENVLTLVLDRAEQTVRQAADLRARRVKGEVKGLPEEHNIATEDWERVIQVLQKTGAALVCRGANAALNSQRPERSEEDGQPTSATLSLLH